MTYSRFPGRRVRRGRPGLPGSDTITAGWQYSVDNRLLDLESEAVNVSFMQLTDVDIDPAPTEGQFYYWDTIDNKFKPRSMPSFYIYFSIPFVFDGAGAAITAKDWYAGFRFYHDATILGWTMVSPGGGVVTGNVAKATYAAYPTFTDISGTGTQRPNLASGNKNESTNMTGWTTAVTTGDLMKVSTVSGATSTYAVMTLYMRRTITLA